MPLNTEVDVRNEVKSANGVSKYIVAVPKRGVDGNWGLYVLNRLRTLTKGRGGWRFIAGANLPE
jgi:hypothetical protein